MAAELYGAEYWVRENRLRRALNAELRRLSARTDEEAYAALLSLSLFRRVRTQTEQAAVGSGEPEREIPATALCAETAKAGKPKGLKGTVVSVVSEEGKRPLRRRQTLRKSVHPYKFSDSCKLRRRGKHRAGLRRRDG